MNAKLPPPLYPPPLPPSHLEAEPRAWLGQTLENPQACSAQGDCLSGGGEEEELHCALHCVQREEIRGGLCLTVSSCPTSLPWGLEVQTDIREATLWFNVPGPSLGQLVLVPALTPREGPLRTAAGLTPAGGPPPRGLLLLSGFSLPPGSQRTN